jgi:hypothetical protein
MLRASVGTPGGQMKSKDVTQENTVPISNALDTSNNSVPAPVTQERSKESSSSNDVLNPMLNNTSVGTQGGQMKSMNKTQENTVPTSNALDTSKNSVPASVTQERSKESSTNNDVLNPLGSASVGIQGGQMKPMNMTQENTVPMSNPVSKSPQVTPEEFKQRTAGAESSKTTNNPMQAQASANAGQKTGGSLTPGILSNGGKLLTLTIPGKDQLKLKIGDCIEFTKNGKKQSGNIVDFYKSNSQSNIVDIIFIDLFDKNQGKFIAKTIRETDAQERHVLDAFYNQNIGGNTDEAQNKILVDYPNYRPDGITLTSVFSSQYNDVGVWQTISKCSNSAAEAASIISGANRNIQAATDVNAELDRQIAAVTNNINNNNNNRNNNNNNNNNNQSGGSKSKTLKKKQQNIKIRLV